MHAFGEPPSIDEVPVPTVRGGGILVKTAASDVVDSAKLMLASELGAEMTIDASMADPAAVIQKRSAACTARSSPRYRAAHSCRRLAWCAGAAPYRLGRSARRLSPADRLHHA